jgi:hypothetical protein
VRLEHDVRVRRENGDGAAVGERGQDAGEPPAPVVELAVGEVSSSVDHGRALGKHRGRPVQERDRTQRLE